MFAINSRPENCQILGPDDTFKCRRPRGEACSRVGGDVEVVLTPYDILRLKKALDLSSTDFLARYTKQETDPQSKLPMIFLDFANSGEVCTFLEAGICTRYGDRPATCRLYPLGIAGSSCDGRLAEECFLTPGAGTDAPDSWTVASWLAEQEYTALDANLNHQWLELLVFKSQPDAIPPDPRMKALFAMVAYDLDKFRRFIFETPFLSIFEISQKAAEPLKNDDLELLQFGFRYLRMMLGLECTLTISDEVRRNAFPSDPSIANLYLRF